MKMKRVWILLLAILLAVPATASIASASGHQHGHSGYLGYFEYSNGEVKGKFVNFQVNSKSGVIENYTVGNTTIFEKISYENNTIGHIRVSGARFFYYGVASPFGWNNTHKMGYMWRVIMVHDNPVGVLHIVTHGQDVIKYHLAQGINATLSNSTVVLSGKVSAYLFISNALPTIQNNTIYIKTRNNATASVIFIDEVNLNIPKKIKNMEIKSLQKHKLGGEMYIGPKGTDFVNYTYGMNAKLTMKEKNHLQIQVSAQGVKGGRIMLINVNRTMLNYNSSMRLIVKFDGKEINKTSMNNLINCSSSQAMYAVYNNNDTVSIAIYIPHFSEHVIDVESEASSSGTSSGGSSASGGTSNAESSNENTKSSEGMPSPMLWGIVAAIIVIIIVAGVAVAKKSKSN
ncbi:hypothetical protein [Candidatus Aciduliprofundum boonei]|uniref:Uncharacterized protein n=1 Tax=Aciduliprofundum boonei (strain DSM 19572 / T469) TaxID=439481 RepID=D3TCV8_ACIB4|nr:hypothetical protein [Candidatus Aciduliprofundum boonei]ADD08393.1 hypothetical protein Aboo_0582 [Aciduliprofundum boonei T469]